jgi:VCBS repeat-containing protein
VEVLPADANDTSELRLCSPGPERFIATNRDVGTVVDLGSFPAGTELIFCIFNRNRGERFLMGPASRNPDNIEHAVVDQVSPGVAIVGFEDVFGGFDRDYNDNRFKFTGVTQRPPVANADSYVTDEDVSLVVPAPGVLGNDTDVDGDALSAAVITGPAHGSLALNGDGSFAYTPTPNYNGPDSFTYRASDGSADSAPATVTITVRPVNDAPSCASVKGDTAVFWPPNHALRVVTLSGGTDIEGDRVSITVTGVTQDEPVNGLGDGDTGPDAVAAQASNQVSLRAERSGGGDGRVYVIHYTASDPNGGSCIGAVQVSVPHSQGVRGSAVDSGQTVNSFGP